MKKKLLLKYVHRSHQVIIAACLLVLVVAAISDVFDKAGWTKAVMAVGITIAFALTFGIIDLTKAHRGNLCDDCGAGMPLNGSEQAEKWNRSLATVHWYGASRFRMYTVNIAVVLGYFAASLVTGGLASPGMVLFTPLAGWFFISMSRHALVQPWCRRCHWGRGDDREKIQTPAPPGLTVDA